MTRIVRVALGVIVLVVVCLTLAAPASRTQEVTFETITLTVDSVLVQGQRLPSLSAYADFDATLTAETAAVLRFQARSGQSFEIVYERRGPGQ